MDRTAKPSLKLNRETVRALTVNEMTQVAGGAAVMRAQAISPTVTCYTISRVACAPVKIKA